MPSRSNGTAGAPRQAQTRWDAVAFVFLALLAAVVFRVHLLGEGTFIGDGDRLNSFLNMRLFEVDALRAGQAPTWNESMFMGFAASSLHYMLAGADPVAYLEALVPREELFRVAGYASMTLLVLAGWTAYLFIRHTCSDRFYALLGAALYESSVFAMARITQVDSAFWVLILMPAAMLAMRTLAPGRSASGFLMLAVIFSALLLFTFMQEAAYAIILVGSFAVYRGLQQRSMRPIAVFGAAVLVAIVIGAPRILSVLGEVQGLDRHATLHLTCPCELLRWFNDGIFGRFPSEARRVGNAGMNLREGLQLHTSVLAALVVLVGALRRRGAVESAATVVLFLVLGLSAAPLIGYPAAMITVGLPLIVHLVLREVGLHSPAPRWRGLLPPAAGEDVVFHLLFVAVTLAVVLLEPARLVFHRAFLGLDLTHSRFSLAGLLPVCTLVAIFLQEWLGPVWSQLSWGRRGVALAMAAPSAVASLWLIDASSVEPVARWFGLSSDWLRTHVSYDNIIVPGEAMRVISSLSLLLVLLSSSWLAVRSFVVRRETDRYVIQLTRANHDGRRMLHTASLLCLALVTVFQGIGYAQFQLNGPQVRSFPIPFKHNDFFIAPMTALRPPTDEAIRAVRQRLETDAYRSVLVADLTRFPAVSPPMEPAYGAHLAQYWRLRLIGGYGAGVSGRLAGLPWPDGTRTLRTLSFQSEGDLPWPLLALLNVKYALTVDSSLYYNLGSEPGAGREAGVEDLLLHENPVRAVPRQFFAESVQPVPPASTRESASRLSRVLPRDPVKESLVEGYPAAVTFSTAGHIVATYAGGHIELLFDPASQPRFLVLNEMYHPRWRAFAQDGELTIYPTNVVMRGLVVPPGVNRIVLRFVPFSSSRASLVFYVGSVALGCLIWWRFRHQERVP